MNRIIYVGMDVHRESYTLCCVEQNLEGEDKVFGHLRMEAKIDNVKRYLKKIASCLLSKGIIPRFVCGYEAGCLGYSLYYQMREAGFECVVMAPATLFLRPRHVLKNDMRDAEHIAKSLAYGNYRAVYIPSVQDEEVREFIRMRNDHKQGLKRLKQQIGAFCLRHVMHYDKTKWTQVHLRWLETYDLRPGYREVLDRYLLTYHMLQDLIEQCDLHIEEISQEERYREKVAHLCCFKGIRTQTSISLIVETGSFARFATAEQFASYLGLIPRESSSGDTIRRGSITKTGNRELRRLLIESAHSICRGRSDRKSKALKARQRGNPPEVIAYADRAVLRLSRKYFRMIRRGKKTCVAITAVARELACFVWGMMNGRFELRVTGQKV
ncbi:MAG: IS110 family transposase [Saccharofermentanales bacterium]